MTRMHQWEYRVRIFILCFSLFNSFHLTESTSFWTDSSEEIIPPNSSSKKLYTSEADEVGGSRVEDKGGGEESAHKEEVLDNVFVVMAKTIWEDNNQKELAPNNRNCSRNYDENSGTYEKDKKAVFLAKEDPKKGKSGNNNGEKKYNQSEENEDEKTYLTEDDSEEDIIIDDINGNKYMKSVKYKNDKQKSLLIANASKEDTMKKINEKAEDDFQDIIISDNKNKHFQTVKYEKDKKISLTNEAKRVNKKHANDETKSYERDISKDDIVEDINENNLFEIRKQPIKNSEEISDNERSYNKNTSSAEDLSNKGKNDTYEILGVESSGNNIKDDPSSDDSTITDDDKKPPSDDSSKSSSSDDADDQKTLSQQVAEGKYGLIHNELFTPPPKRPGIISYRVNPEVPKDNVNNLGGLEADDIWLAENHLLVLAGAALKGAHNLAPWNPIDNYEAPKRPITVPSNPSVPPPFPIQLYENGPIRFVGKQGPQKPAFTNPLPPYEKNPQNYFPPTLGRHPPPPIYGPPPKPGSAFLPPTSFGNNSEAFDEEDPSLYYPPKYDFFYTPSNATSRVPAGPLVPGIVLPPPPDFFNYEGTKPAEEKPKKSHEKMKYRKPIKSVTILDEGKPYVPLKTKTKSPKEFWNSENEGDAIREQPPVENNSDINLPGIPIVADKNKWIPIPSPIPYYITGEQKHIKESIAPLSKMKIPVALINHELKKARKNILRNNILGKNHQHLEGDELTTPRQLQELVTPMVFTETTITPLHQPSPISTTIVPAKPYHPPLVKHPANETVRATYYFYEEPKDVSTPEISTVPVLAHQTTPISTYETTPVSTYQTTLKSVYPSYEHPNYDSIFQPPYSQQNEVTTSIPHKTDTKPSILYPSYDHLNYDGIFEPPTQQLEVTTSIPLKAAKKPFIPVIPLHYLAQVQSYPSSYAGDFSTIPDEKLTTEAPNYDEYYNGVRNEPLDNYIRDNHHSKSKKAPPIRYIKEHTTQSPESLNYLYPNYDHPGHYAEYDELNNNYRTTQKPATLYHSSYPNSANPVFEYSYSALGYEKPSQIRLSEFKAQNQDAKAAYAQPISNIRYNLRNPPKKVATSTTTRPSSFLKSTVPHQSENPFQGIFNGAHPQYADNSYYEDQTETVQNRKPLYSKKTVAQSHSQHAAQTQKPYIAQTTENPFHAFFTIEDEEYIDDNTKNYFSIFGQKIPSYQKTTTEDHERAESSTPSPKLATPEHYPPRRKAVAWNYNQPRAEEQRQNPFVASLEGDTDVNYKSVYRANPDAELIDGFGLRGGNLVKYDKKNPFDGRRDREYQKPILRNEKYTKARPGTNRRHPLNAPINHRHPYSQPSANKKRPTSFISDTRESSTILSLAGDILVNYRKPLPAIEPEAELIDVNRQEWKPMNSDSYL